MKTYQLKKENVIRKWHTIDASDQVLGRLAVKIANILRGKNNPNFTPHVDSGDFVVVTNCDKIKITGNKFLQKKYHHYSGYPGGLKETTFQQMLEKHPERIIYYAVKGMLPKNKLQARMLTRLRVFAGTEHPHGAQKPEATSAS